MPTESATKLKKGVIITSGIFPEKVEVITIEETGTNCTVLARGLKTGHIHEKILNSEQLEELQVSASAADLDFKTRAEEFFLGIEANRVRLAFEFDPLFALNASRVDAVPHQLEAVYRHILPHHKRRPLFTR